MVESSRLVDCRRGGHLDERDWSVYPSSMNEVGANRYKQPHESENAKV